VKLEVMIFKGSHPERVHAVRDGHDPASVWFSPRCGVWSTGARRRWRSTLAEVDCGRCLASLRAKLTRDRRAVEDRLAGRGGIQMDISELRRAK